MPILTILAGPNGAGKSTHSKELCSDFGIEAFDYDKEFLTIWAQFNSDPFIEQGAFERAQKSFADKRAIALDKKQNFAFETNFHSNDALSTVELFRAKRYHIELIFIALENSSIAIERVKDRVAKGGHVIDETTIRERFDAGLKMLDENFSRFDLVSLYLSKPGDIGSVFLVEPPRDKAISILPIPTALASWLPNLAGFIEKNK